MCNDYERQIEAHQYAEALQAAGLQPAGEWPEPAGVQDVRVGDSTYAFVARGNGAALTEMRWGFAPARKGAPPVFNFRGEGRRFDRAKRCIVPASAFFEFTGRRSPKSKWRFAPPGEPVIGVAGLWHEEAEGPSFTMLTVPPGDEVAPFHDRQIALLAPSQWADWLYLSSCSGELLQPLPAGSLAISLARPGAETPDEWLLACAAQSRRGNPSV